MHICRRMFYPRFFFNVYNQNFFFSIKSENCCVNPFGDQHHLMKWPFFIFENSFVSLI